MDFSVPPDHQLAVDSLRRFAKEEIEPLALEYRDRFIPRETMKALLAKLLPFGLGNGLVSEDLGGMGLSRCWWGACSKSLPACRRTSR